MAIKNDSLEDQINEIFGDDLDSIAEANTELINKLLRGEIQPEEIAVNVVSGDSRTFH